MIFINTDKSELSKLSELSKDRNKTSRINTSGSRS